MGEPSGATLGDIAQVFQFFGAVYAGTPLVLTYGETSLSALGRRRTNCVEAVGEEALHRLVGLDAVESALEDLRIAVERPIIRGGLRAFLLLGAAHVIVGLLIAAAAAVEVSSPITLIVFAAVIAIFCIVAVRGVVDVVIKEAAAVRCVSQLELEARAPTGA